MTDLQDEILDRLVGTKIGLNWPDGPLTIAATVVGGKKAIKFGMTDNDRGAKSEIAKRLGYPILLVEAIQGGNRAFTDEDDRRSFAMGVFQLIPIGGKIARLSPKAQNSIAARMAIRAHPFACGDTKCPALRALDELAQQADLNPQARYRVVCSTAKRPFQSGVGTWLTARSSKIDRLVQMCGQVVKGFEEANSTGGWNSVRESVRMACTERGISEGVEFCVEIARQWGMMGLSERGDRGLDQTIPDRT